MKPITTAETEREIQPAPGDEGSVGPLPAFFRDGAIVSIWEPDVEDQHVGATVRFGVQLEVLGVERMPPIRLTIVTLHETPMALERSVLVEEHEEPDAPAFPIGTPTRDAISELAKMGGLPSLADPDTA